MTVGLPGNGFLKEVISKVVVDPPATTSLRWSLVYRIPQRKYTWCLVKAESTSHENELCNDALPGVRLIAINKTLVFVSAVVQSRNDKIILSVVTCES